MEMKRKFPRLAALAVALALAVSMVLPAAAADAAPVETAAQEAMTYAATYGQAVSIQYALWQDGEITAAGGSGVYSKTENQALTEDILYGVGSVSKIYTTVAVMQLAEKGKVNLDAPVTRYLKDFKMADPRYEDITVRMLLNHSSGIMGTGLSGAVLFDDTDPSATDGLLEALATQRLAAAPGEYSVYCNDGFTLAELVVEAVSGMDFMDYVRSNILSPAGLSSTFAPGDDFDTSRLAKTYTGSDTRALPQDCLTAVGAGGMYATASDLASFGGALTGTQLLKTSSLEAMAYPEYSRGVWPDDTLDSLAYGLGWDNMALYPFCQSGITALAKGGDTLRYHAALVVLPEYDMAAAVVSSGGVSTYNQMAAGKILIAALAEEGVTVDESIPALPEAASAAMPQEMKDYAGYYASTTVQYKVEISDDGTLTLHCTTYPVSVPDQTFTYCSDGTFRDAAGSAALSFVEEDNGETYLHQKAVSPLPGLGGLPTSNYAAVKLADNAVTPELQSVWDDLLTMSLLPMDEKYDSQIYLALGEAVGEVPDSIPGYMGAARITDETAALFAARVPGTGGRDGMDYHLEDRSGITWVSVGQSAYMDLAGAPELFTGSGWAYTTVQSDGYARWYQVGAAAGKAMTVQAPQDAGFWVYNADGTVAASSVLWGDTAVTLPEGGLVVFAGDPGARFHLRFAA